ncbi:surface antigen-like protein [Flavobacteriaceae bacterium MAR_2010_105]|nr:surface antigen-like protein [Flavobacteriaceae bacterium MAR_2010_105]
MKNRHFNIVLFLIPAVLLTSCNVMKRVGENDYLLTQNTVLVNEKNTKTEEIYNLIYQKPNNKLPLLGIPLRVHIYNLARPNIDSILEAKIYDNPDKLARKIRLLSKKQLIKDLESRKNFNSWLKKTGEPPVILDELKAEKTTTQLNRYFFSKGWFDVETSHDIEKREDQRANVTYNVNTGKPYILDSISTKIASPIIDSLYQNSLKKGSLLKKTEQYDEVNFEIERERLTTGLRNSGLYHFGQDYISFDIDTIGSAKKVNTEVIIKNRAIREQDTTLRIPFKVYKIKEVNIFTDYSFENRNLTLDKTLEYNNFNLYSYDKLKYRPKAITDAIFITKGDVFKDIDRTRTYRYLSELQAFKYPNIEYIENVNDTTLTANIYLSPKKKYELGFSFDVSQSNIQTIGFSFRTGLLIRNIFRGAETLEVSALGAIGASKDASNNRDQFFDINEVGANARLTIPRLFFPISTEKIIPKYMSPSTRISLSASGQRNIGLDKQSFSGIINYRWKPSRTVTNDTDLFNVQFVKNLNTANYFGVYQNSFNRLNDIARDINYIGNDTSLTIPDQANAFINDVLNNNTSLNPGDDDYVNVNNIAQRKQRLTENNLIFASNFNYVKDRKDNLFDKDFSIFRARIESAGNLLSNFSKLFNQNKNADGNYEVFGVPYSQYIKTELDYIKHWDLGRDNILAIRTYFGIAIPYGNSQSIPFSKSFFGGGPNDNRAWAAYNLGPGSTQSSDEFNEANMKITASIEQRFNLLGRFNGAVFVDAGNIWNVLDNVEDEKATFNDLRSLKDIAIGSGFGLRYDFSFFVLRADVGFKTYDPSYELGDRWFKDYNFSNAVYNIGINYPF